MRIYIWNFYGMNGKGTAAHHRIHLEEFAAKNNIPTEKYKTSLKEIDEYHSQCIIELDKDYSELIKILKPHEMV